MKIFNSNFLMLLLALFGGLSASVNAHLMEAQRGTLNFVNDGVYMVLSLPISAFDGLDDNGDGEVSMLEFNKRRGVIVESVEREITLSNETGKQSLQGVMLSPVLAHDSHGHHLSQLIVMGKFVAMNLSQAPSFRLGLYGKDAAEQRFDITVTHRPDNRTYKFKLTPLLPQAMVFAEAS